MTVAVSYEPPPQDAELEESRALWAAFDLVEQAGLLDDITLEMWQHIPEDVSRDHELDKGRLIRRQSGSRGHQRASRRLANAVEAAAKRAVQECAHPCLEVEQDLDTRLWEVPRATVRRPDVLVYRCLEPGAVVWAKDVLLVIEIVSPSSRATDTGRDDPLAGFESKMTQYARAGITHYWIVRLRADDSGVQSVEEWRLLEGTGKYARVALRDADTSDDAVHTEWPFRIHITWSDLEF